MQSALLSSALTRFSPERHNRNILHPQHQFHRNPINSSLIALPQRHVPQHTYSDKDHPKSKKEHHCPDWVTSLVHPHQTIPKPSEFLSGTHFAEFPTIHAHDPDSSTFIGNIVAKRGQPSPMSEQEHEHGVRAMKRRKLSTKAGRMAISGLVGNYGSESDSASEKAAASQTRDDLRALGSYAESENGDQDTAVEAGTTEDDMYSTGFLSADEGEGPALDCAAVLELIKQAHSAADCDSEAVDWGDDCDEDVAE
ncbi:hypothetical protein CY34DRAFT_13323 [Suillus luteus UH-Slu-Lm8-n1]|uniref:Unplaced genomic scaffold CY34scaffold_151, whole genome shotgun sequence n=1 Tax=Suillus luteus UH-Slu-Lm8-n1 TaxID=930992 RepID=A0A0D0B3I4_9AGAM|nr:hypothetical protein CY34DRAFT_13323 [Suillus luteus UH-Slu-Lm8-n1]